MELEITWNRAVRIWWSYLWRNLIAIVIAIVIGMVIGAFIGFILGAMGVPLRVIQIVVTPFGFVMGLAISVVPMKMILGKDFGEFRLVLLAKQTPQPDTTSDSVNEAIRILGSKVDPDRIIGQLNSEYDLDGAKTRAPAERAHVNKKIIIKICPSCRAYNDDSNSACLRCGALLPA